MNRGILEVVAEIFVSPCRHLSQIRIGARIEFAFMCNLGPAVPRTDIEAVVTAEQVVADGLAKFGGNGPLVFDCQVGDTAARVELVGSGNGTRRANIDAGGAIAAMVGHSRIGRVPADSN